MVIIFSEFCRWIPMFSVSKKRRIIPENLYSCRRGLIPKNPLARGALGRGC
jgi:hypothetical protein